MATRSNSTRGFTLLELLVSVAIISLLMALMIPSMRNARELARKSVCATQLKGLLTANTMYATENDGRYMLAAEDMWGQNLRRWHGYRKDRNSAFDPYKGPFINYMGSGGIKQCPSFQAGVDYSDDAGQGAGFEAGCGGYGYNAVYIGGRSDLFGISPKSSRQSAAMEHVGSPAETVMFTDSAYMQSGKIKIAYSFCEPPYWEMATGKYDMTPDPSIDFRHLSKCNVAWCDGHVDDRKLSFSVDYKTHGMITGEEGEGCGIGWFGPQSNKFFDLE